MKLTNSGGVRLPVVHLALTESEAQKLLDTLEILLADPSSGRHEHVSSDYATEISLVIER